MGYCCHPDILGVGSEEHEMKDKRVEYPHGWWIVGLVLPLAGCAASALVVWLVWLT